MAGYVPEKNALWIQTRFLRQALKGGPSEIGQFFSPAKPFAKRLSRVLLPPPEDEADGYGRWRHEGTLTIAEPLFSASERKVLNRLAGTSLKSVRFRGAVVLGHDEKQHLFWVAVRELRAREVPDRTAVAEWCAATNVDFVAAWPRLKPLDWLPPVAIAEVFANAPDSFREFSRRLFESMLPVGTALERRGSVDWLADGAPLGFPGRVPVWTLPVAGAHTRQSVADAYLAVSGDLETRRPRPRAVIAVTSLDEATVVALLRSAPWITGWEKKAQFLVIGAGTLTGLLSRAPWLWSRYVGDTCGFSVVLSSDDQHMRSQFLRSPLSALVPITEDLVHPAIPAHGITARGRLRIVGRPGSGKTTAIYHLLRRGNCPVVIVVPPALSGNDLDTLSRLLENLTNQPTPRALALVFDDLHLAADGPAAQTPFGYLLEQIRKRKASVDQIGIVVAYWSSEVEAVSATYEPLFVRAGIGAAVSIDTLPSPFGVELVRRAAVAFRIEIDPDIVPLLIERVVTRHATVHGLLSALYAHRDDAITADTAVQCAEDGRWYWASAFERLARDERWDQIAVLQIVSLARLSLQRPAPATLLEHLFTSWYGGTPMRCWLSVASLEQQAWVRRIDNLVCSDDVQIDPRNVLLEDDAGATTTAAQFCKWLLETTEAVDPVFRENALWVFGRSLPERDAEIGRRALWHFVLLDLLGWSTDPSTPMFYWFARRYRDDPPERLSDDVLRWTAGNDRSRSLLPCLAGWLDEFGYPELGRALAQKLALPAVKS